MHSTQFIYPLGGMFSLATGAVIRPHDTPAPWEISSLSTFSPSGRPGSSPYSTLNVTITDPNIILAGPAPTGNAVFAPTTAVCNTSFVGTAPPYNQVLSCSEVQNGYWTFEMLEANTNPSGTMNFDISFTHVSRVTVGGRIYAKVYTGTGHFEVGKAMTGTCGGSGVCSWGLKDSERPYLVYQSLVSCTGLC